MGRRRQPDAGLSWSKYPPAEPEALRLPASQRGLIATGKKISNIEQGISNLSRPDFRLTLFVCFFRHHLNQFMMKMATLVHALLSGARPRRGGPQGQGHSSIRHEPARGCGLRLLAHEPRPEIES